MKLIKKIATALMAFTLCMGISACGDKSWAIKTDKDTVSSSIYTYNLLVAYREGLNKLLDNGISVNEITDETIDDKNAVDWVKDRAIELSKDYIVTEQMFKDLGLEVTEEEANSASETTDSIWEQAGETYEKRFGINKDTVNQAYSLLVLKKDKIFNAMYGEGGPNTVTDEELSNFYNQNYVAVKFYTKVPFEQDDEEENDSEQENAEQTEVEQEQVDTDESIQKQFTEYVNLFNSGKKTEAEISEMIVKTDNLSEGMNPLRTQLINTASDEYPEIAEAVKSLEAGKATQIKYNSIYILLYRDPSLKIEELSDLTNEDDKKRILLEMKASEFKKKVDEEISKLNITKNEEVIKEIDPNMFGKTE